MNRRRHSVTWCSFMSTRSPIWCNDTLSAHSKTACARRRTRNGVVCGGRTDGARIRAALGAARRGVDERRFPYAHDVSGTARIAHV